AQSLRPGDAIYSLRDGWLRVSNATWTDRRTTVYNLKVDEFHTYFVGEAGAWVHNAPCVGRTGGQERLRQIASDPKTPRADRGWIQQEMNSIARGQRTTIRNPPGKQLAHTRGREAAKGYDHVESPSNLQDTDLHRTQHRFDDFGRANK